MYSPHSVHNRIVSHASGTDGPIKQPLVKDGDDGLGIIFVGVGFAGQRFNFFNVAFNAHRARGAVEVVNGGIIFGIGDGRNRKRCQENPVARDDRQSPQR